MLDLFTEYVPKVGALAEQLAQGLSPRLRYALTTLWDSPAPLGLKRQQYEATRP